MNKTLLFIMLLMVAMTAKADLVSVSGGVFSYKVDGSLRNDPSASNTIDLKNDLGMKDDKEFQGFLYIEHPIPILPNIRIGRTNLKLTGDGTTTKPFTFNGTNFPTSGLSIKSNADLSHTDLGVYWNLWDTGFKFDLGLNAKIFDSKVTLNANNGTYVATTTFSKTIPLLYTALAIPVPGTGFKFAGDLSTVSYNGDSFTDYLVRLRYDTDFALGIELGYRSISIKYENGNENYRLDAKGPYLNATLSF